MSVRSRRWRDVVKEGRPVTAGGQVVPSSDFLAGKLASVFGANDLRLLFSDKPILVPVPRSSPVKSASLFPAKLICDGLVKKGLGSQTCMLLERTHAVPKAAFCDPQDRPTLQIHFDSLKVVDELIAATSILIVDDVVTSGLQLLACASRLKERYPDVEIRAFAMVRTMSGVGVEVAGLEEMCVGKITRVGDRTRRRP